MLRLGLIVLALVALAVVIAACGDDDRGGRETTVDRLDVGDCLFYAAPGDVRPVYCFEPHHAEVIAVLTMPDGPYPGDDGINSFAGDCPEETNTFVYPTANTWAAGDRAIFCLDEFEAPE